MHNQNLRDSSRALGEGAASRRYESYVYSPGIESDPSNVELAALGITYHHSMIYLHEIALGQDGSGEDFRPPFRLRAPSETSYTLPDLHPARLDCIIASLTSAHSLLDTVLKLSPQSLRVFPVWMYIRVTYAIVILLKIFFISSTPGSELGQIIHPVSVRVEDYLDRLVSCMQVVSNDENCRLTDKFSSVFSRARDWFRRQTLQTDWNGGAGEQGLLEPFRLLTMNDGPAAFKGRCPLATAVLHESAAAQLKDLGSNLTNVTGQHSASPDLQPLAEEPDLMGHSAITSGAQTWQHSMPWDFQSPRLDIAQPEYGILGPPSEPILVEDQTQIPLGEFDNIMDDSFDLVKGFDFDSHFWDFEMGELNTEYI